jgi:hypothetical protein
MVRDLQNRIVKYGKGERIALVHKIALTKAQIKKYDVPTTPPKEDDVRTKAFIEKHGSKTAELDAIDPKDLQPMVETAIKKYIVPDRWNESVDKVIRGQAADNRNGGHNQALHGRSETIKQHAISCEK